MLKKTETREAKGDLKTRHHLSERSFARSIRYGFKRARWRRLWRVAIQDFLICAIQNLLVLIAQSPQKLSKGTARRGQSLRAHRAPWEKYSFGSLLTKFLNQFAMAFDVA
jgi:hypothetical protein